MRTPKSLREWVLVHVGLLDHIWKAWAHIQRREDTPRWPLPLALLDLQAVLCQYEQEKNQFFKHTWKQVWHHHSITSVATQEELVTSGIPWPLLSDHLKVHSTRGQQVSLLGRDDGWRQLGMLQRPLAAMLAEKEALGRWRLLAASSSGSLYSEMKLKNMELQDEQRQRERERKMRKRV